MTRPRPVLDLHPRRPAALGRPYLLTVKRADDVEGQKFPGLAHRVDFTLPDGDTQHGYVTSRAQADQMYDLALTEWRRTRSAT